MNQKAKLKILVLFDLNQRVAAGYDWREDFKTDGFETEADVCRALKRLGHDVEPLSLFDDIAPLLAAFAPKEGVAPPDLVFNLSEAFRIERRHEPHMASLLELLGVPYTGADPTALAVCKDKALAKTILSYHHVKTPRFLVSPRNRPLKRLKPVSFPAFVKPIATEGSEGIAQAARVEDEKAALERVAFVHESVGSDALIEEFIEGRELYAGVLGNERLQSLPLVELFVGNAPIGDEAAPEGAPTFFTYRAKWDAAYRKKWGIRAGAPRDLPPAIEKRIGEIARRVYHSLRISGYGRVDLRLTPAGDIYVIEVNPNPGLAASDEFAKAAARGDLPYDVLIARILQLAAERAIKGVR
jgi:D-alanine-D-alanine ligase